MSEHALYLFIQLVQDHRILGYTILFLAMVLEGETFLIIAGMLASLGAFDAGDVLWVSFTGVVLGNTLWYVFGSKLKSTSFARPVIRRAEKVITFFLPRFKEKPFKSIFFSKFIYGANRATVVMSGVFHVPFKLFFRAEFLASIVWVGLYFEIGYYLGEAAVGITRKASHLALTAVIFIVGFILIQKFISKYFERKEREKNEKENNNS